MFSDQFNQEGSQKSYDTYTIIDIVLVKSGIK